MKPLAALLFLAPQFLLAQIGTKESKTYEVFVNDEVHALTARISVLKDKADFDPEEERNYFWYASGKVQQTKGGYEGKLLSGPYSSFYLSGNLREKGNFKKGLKQGKWSSWNPAGGLKEVVNWKQGLKHGRYVLYNEEGKPVLEASYRNDALHGKVKVYEAGKLIGVKNYNRGKEILPDVKGKRENGKGKKLFKKKEKEEKPKKNEKAKRNAITQL